MVLVVDDDDISRQMCARILQKAGYEVRVAADGLAALEILISATPALIVSDLDMPRMDGAALRAALREIPRLATVPFVLVSANTNLQGHARGLDATAIVPKPVAARDLLRYAQLFDRPSS